MRNFLKKYFTFNSGERNGIIVLLTIIVALLITLQVIPYVIKPPIPNTAEFDKQVALLKSIDTASTYVYGNENNNYTHANNYTKTQFKSYNNKKRIEINSADSILLLDLKGIGPAYAHRIIAFRKILGGFYSKEQLKEVYGMDEERFNLLAPQVNIDTTKIQFINLNQTDFATLKKHPYIKYQLAKEIDTHRKTIGSFNTIDEIKKFSSCTAQQFDKLKPYLRTN